MDDSQATDEAVLLFVRKVRRLHPEAFADVMGRLNEGARWALQMAENRADSNRDAVGGVACLAWPMLDQIDETDE